MVEKFYDNRNFKILKINKKTENISMLIIVLCTLLLLVFFLKIKRFYINDIGLFFSAFGAVLISVFPFSIVHEYIHLLSYPKKSRKKIIFKMKNLQPIISVESDAKMSKCRTLIMLISPTLVLAIIPIFLSFIIKKLILMTFLIFFSFSSLAMSASDIYFFIVILLKMRNNELFYQEDNKIYILKKWSFFDTLNNRVL